MPFSVSSADASGARIVGSEEVLSPGPADVDYPLTPAGRIVDTSSGTRIKQTPPGDARPRAWIWSDLPTYRPKYVQFCQRLESLLGTNRRARGLSPWVYLQDTETSEMSLWVFSGGTATAISSTTLTDSLQAWTTNALTNGTIEIVSGTGAGQRRSVQSNTGTSVTVDAWGTNPTGAVYNVQYQNPAWIRVRVLNVSRHPVAKFAISFETVRLEFVIDDQSWNSLG